MLEPLRHILSEKRIVLASGSKSRPEALDKTGLIFEIKVSEFDENLNKQLFSHPSEYVKENAKQKAIWVANKLVSCVEDPRPVVIIGADTVVTLGKEIMEKPKDLTDASEMLKKLSGAEHTVYTGVALLTKSERSSGQTQDYQVTTFHESTDVKMSKLSDEIIEGYVASKEPIGKAGAYAIQGYGATLVEQIRGDYYNLMGIPLNRLCRELNKLYCA